MSSSSYSCLPEGFKFQCYKPLDPLIPSVQQQQNRNNNNNDYSLLQNQDEQEEESIPILVKEALSNFPTFKFHVSDAEKLPVKNVDEAKKVLADGRAENRANSDMESTIADQRLKADVEVEKVLGK